MNMGKSRVQMIVCCYREAFLKVQTMFLNTAGQLSAEHASLNENYFKKVGAERTRVSTEIFLDTKRF